MNNEKYFAKLLEEINITLNEKQMNQFKTVYKELIEWNKNINLTTIIKEDEVIVKHFIDSLVPNQYILNSDKVIDVGTGAGFPGIPLKILKPDISLTLIDTVGKKVNYLNNLINALKLINVEAIHVRAEDLAKENEHREKYDVAISRALANMTTLVEYLLPFTKVGGKAICMKGPNIEEELAASKKAIDILGGKVEKVIPYIVKDMEITYNLVIIKKIKETPYTYPRKSGIPSKKPLI